VVRILGKEIEPPASLEGAGDAEGKKFATDGHGFTRKGRKEEGNRTSLRGLSRSPDRRTKPSCFPLSSPCFSVTSVVPIPKSTRCLAGPQGFGSGAFCLGAGAFCLGAGPRGLRFRTSEPRFRSSKLRHRTFFIRRRSSKLQCRTFWIRRRSSELQCRIIWIRRRSSELRHRRFFTSGAR